MENLGILYRLEMFHHCSFASEISMIAIHKPLVTVFKEDIATLSQGLHMILLYIHQYNLIILYKPGLQPIIVNW